MASDPGRQFLRDQIQQQGFLFLDEYLENILSGPQQDPIIELVKTPGKKKATNKKTKAPGSQLKNVLIFSLEDDNQDKGNAAPLNSFHGALLKSKYDHEDGADPRSRQPTPSIDDTLGLAQIEPGEVTTPSVHEHVIPVQAPSMPEKHLKESSHSTAPTQSEALIPLRLEQNELSIITEDDEPAERSRTEYAEPCLPLRVATAPPAQPQADKNPHRKRDVPQDATRNSSIDSPGNVRSSITTSIPVETFHPISLDSPLVLGDTSSETIQPPASTREEILAPSTGVLSSRDGHPPPVDESHEAQSKAGEGVSHDDHATAKYGMADIKIPIHNEPETDSRSEGKLRKISVPALPTLPEPIPLRKSVRAPRDPSTGIGPILGAATPGVPSGGKRTSWLAKAREVKAMEEIGRKFNIISHPNLNVLQAAIPGGLSSNLKRKSSDMLGVPRLGEVEGSTRIHKLAKNREGEFSTNSEKGIGSQELPSHIDSQTQPPQILPTAQDVQLSSARGEEGMLDRFKKTVEGFGARIGMGTAKSLGGGAAAQALAEAKAAAEARIAERTKPRDITSEELNDEPATSNQPKNSLTMPTHSIPQREQVRVDPSGVSKEANKRLSLSDLVTSNGQKVCDQPKPEEREKLFQFVPPPSVAPELPMDRSSISSVSTTPPNSPPSTRLGSLVFPLGPVFNKPPPVFIPPVTTHMPAINSDRPKSIADQSIPQASAYSHPVSKPIAPTRLPSPLGSEGKNRPGLLSAQSTLESVASDALFDTEDTALAWFPATQDTEYGPSQHSQNNQLDDDDSWPIDERLAADAQWTVNIGSNKDESLTWSTVPTESQRGDTAPLRPEVSHYELGVRSVPPPGEPQQMPGAFIGDEHTEALVSDGDFDEQDIEPGKSTVNLVESKVTRSQSQLSVTSSTSSSQSHAGFLGQATKLVNSVLGTSKKGKTEVKSLRLAAAAAKKQQEEQDRKVARLKEMENRRQLALQKKAEEEKAKSVEQEKKVKEEVDRRKREREEHTDRRALKSVLGKKEDEPTKKRKVVVEIEKKPEAKKPVAKTANPSLNTSAANKPIMKPPSKTATALASSSTYNASHQGLPSGAKYTEAKTVKPESSTSKGKGKAPMTKVPDDDDQQPSQMIQSQMAARAKAQIQAAKQQHLVEPLVPSENIELPDINSEYSDSEDEDRPRTFDPPDWAQSPELRQALQQQSTINPDDIFGAIKPLKMEEIFKTRTSRFRARTSSANWTGTDRLTAEEEREYARRMGFR